MSDAVSRLPHPVDFEEIVRVEDLTIYEPVPPQGFVSIGVIATGNGEKPSVDSVSCVPNELVRFHENGKVPPERAVTVGDKIFFSNGQIGILAVKNDFEIIA